jgi:hypothetical protein
MTKLWITATLFAVFARHAAAESDGREFLGSVQARKQGRYQDAQRDLEAHFDEREIRRAAIERSSRHCGEHAGVQLSVLRLTRRSHPPGLFSAFRGTPGQPRDGPSSSSRLPDDGVKISGRTSYYENHLVESEKVCRPHRGGRLNLLGRAIIRSRVRRRCWWRLPDARS